MIGSGDVFQITNRINCPRLEASADLMSKNHLLCSCTYVLSCDLSLQNTSISTSDIILRPTPDV